MTSVAHQSQPSSQANNASSSTTQATVSYASATKKSVTTPSVATGSGHSSAALAISGNEPVQQNGKPIASPVNGRSSVAPAVPSFSSNNNNNDNARQGSMTITPSLATGGPVGGQKVGIQFGSLPLNSPAASHSSLQPSQASAPIAIPGGNARDIISPANSPSPIPQPITSGGRPPTEPVSSNGIAFGSLPGGDGDVSFS